MLSSSLCSSASSSTQTQWKLSIASLLLLFAKSWLLFSVLEKYRSNKNIMFTTTKQYVKIFTLLANMNVKAGNVGIILFRTRHTVMLSKIPNIWLSIMIQKSNWIYSILSDTFPDNKPLLHCHGSPDSRYFPNG